MHFGHLPAGYITSKLLYGKLEHRAPVQREFMLWGMVGSVAPDFDLLYYFTIGQFKLHHHNYFTHYPLFWLMLLIASPGWMILDRNRAQRTASAFIFTFSGFLHTILDAFSENFLLLAPFINKQFYGPAYLPKALTRIPFWNYGLELLVILWAAYLWLKSPESTAAIQEKPDERKAATGRVPAAPKTSTRISDRVDLRKKMPANPA